MGYISGPQLFIFTSARLAKDGLGYLSWFQNNHSFDSHPSCIKIVFKSLYAHACGVIYFFLYVIHLWYIVVLPVGFQWIVWILLNFVCMLKTRVGLIFFILSTGKEAYQARPRSWRWDFFRWSPTTCLKCSSSWPCHTVISYLRIFCLPIILFFFSKRVLIDIFLCRKPVKIGIRYLEDGTKVRVSRGEGASGSIIPRPEILKIRTTPRPTVGIYLKLITFVFFF